MGLARDLAALESLFRERGDIDLFAPIEQSNLGSMPEFAGLLPRIVLTEPAAVVRLCLQALRVQHDEIRPRLIDAELVATLPSDSPGIARPTASVVTEMVTSATREVILLGYELTDRDLVRVLGDAASRGVQVIMICDRGRGSAARVSAVWPCATSRPRIFHNRDRSDGAPYASMHAKCLLIDSTDLLVTSANFTFHGLHGNIEIGVRISGAPAHEARKVFSYLVEDKIVEEL
jgi:phosphatidylserine/phosphatidylglycerophosphate/cardiolipin synthase-like enzyme